DYYCCSYRTGSTLLF
nr:immunoglobulin light chain junction region [Macaca mulatta]